MLFVKIIESLFIVIGLLFIVTQFLVPVILGRQLFPLFRKTSELETKLAEANQELHDKHLQKEIQEVEAEVEQVVVKVTKPRKPRVSKTKPL